MKIDQIDFKICSQLIFLFSFFSADLIESWRNLLNWSENASKARCLQEEIISQKLSLDLIDVGNDWELNSEEAIREKINEILVSKINFYNFQGET